VATSVTHAAADPERGRRFAFVPGAGAPFPVARTEGAWLILPDGRRILDAAGGAIVANVGHGRREVAQAVARALERIDYVVPPFATEERVALVERLVERWLPPGLVRIAFTSGGSESVDAALRLARQHHVAAGRPERWKIVGRDLSYHGTTLATLAAGGHAKRRAGLEPLLLDLPKAPACYCLRCPLGLERPGCGVACVDAIDQLITREGPETVAAVIAEPVVGSTAGALVPPDDYWPRLAAICRRHGALLIADEVMTGFGRTGVAADVGLRPASSRRDWRRSHERSPRGLFACHRENVRPDLLCLAKGLTGGYLPMAATLTTRRVFDAFLGRYEEFKTFYHGHSYTANQLGASAALASLGILESPDSIRARATLQRVLSDELKSLWSLPNVGDIRQVGLVAGIELVQDWRTRRAFDWRERAGIRVGEAMAKRGVLTRPVGDVIVLMPPYCTTPAQARRMVGALRDGVAEVLQRNRR